MEYQVVNFLGMPDALIVEGNFLFRNIMVNDQPRCDYARSRVEYISRTELILDFLSMPRFGKVLLDLDAHGDEMESPDFARGLDVRSVNIPYLLARYPRRIAAGRKSGAHISSGQFVAMGPERQPDAAAGALGVAQDAPIVDEDAQADPAPAITGLVRMMDRAGVAYVPYSETHVPYQRCQVRQRTGEASTSAAQQDPQQPDP
ncbi:hypothetical protein Tco_0465020 [Tanacetum coccineum]